MKKEEEENAELNGKYNEHVIEELTGLKDEEINKFMKFCNFQDKYILSIDDYNLYSEILLKFEAYKKAQEDSLKNDKFIP